MFSGRTVGVFESENDTADSLRAVRIKWLGHGELESCDSGDRLMVELDLTQFGHIACFS